MIDAKTHVHRLCTIEPYYTITFCLRCLASHWTFATVHQCIIPAFACARGTHSTLPVNVVTTFGASPKPVIDAERVARKVPVLRVFSWT